MHIWPKKIFGGITLFLVIVLALTRVSSLQAEPGTAGRAGGAAAPQAGQNDADKPAYQDCAAFLAGLRQAGSSLADLEINPAWTRYAATMDRNWQHFAKRQLEPMQEWVSGELQGADAGAVFYPFSGPDFLNAYTLFPRAKAYLLLALEPLGTAPDFSDGDFQGYVADMQAALHSYLFTDYFVTDRMRAQMSQTGVDGALPVMMFFLARENLRILDIKYWVMTPDGAITEKAAWDEEGFQGGIPGVRVVFQGKNGAGPQTLYYFRLNLLNNTFGRNPHFLSFLKSFGPLTTFSKSASFLLSNPLCSNIREFILEQSRYVLQTDSEIPLKFFSPEVWRLKFFGTYTGPTDMFKGMLQKDLAEAYKAGKDVYPLPFGIGYHYEPGTANLLFAAKQQDRSLTKE